MMFLRCIGRALVDQGMRGLMGIVPFGEKLYDVAAAAVGYYREAKQDQRLSADLEEVLQATSEDIATAAREVAQEVAAGRPAEEVAQLEAYLCQIPGVARQSLRRPQDPSGKTVPASLLLIEPSQLVSVLPSRPPRFRAGDAVPHAPQWRFVELLGAGGFGEVWRARHSFLDQARAFKFCLDPAARDRLLRHEGEVVKRVMAVSAGSRPDEHGIVPLLDAYLEGETPWLAYEYVDGGDLAGLVRQLPQDAARRAAQAIQILRGLATVVGRLHRLPQPIIHRDLKPANVLVKRHDHRWLLRVTDFGISHVAADRGLAQATVSTPSMILGETFRGAHTPIYASPQQKRGHKAQARDDVYALGIIGYQLLLGDLSAERPAGKWRKRLAECQLPEANFNILESCWDDDPEERPKDALELAEGLVIDTPAAVAVAEQPPAAPAVSAVTVDTAPKKAVPAPPPPVFVSPTHKIGDTIVGALGMRLAWVPPGQSWLGGGDGKPGTTSFTLPQGLWCGVYPVTQAEWQAVMGDQPSHFKTNPRYPVESVSWDRVQEFFQKLNQQSINSGLLYRLPTEQEWEYICRGGPISQRQSAHCFYFARSMTDLAPVPSNNLCSAQANFDGNYPAGSASKGRYLTRTCDVGLYLPNSLSIYDLNGNVWEWTSSQEGSARVIRGGCWYNGGEVCAASNRGWGGPSNSCNGVGFRVLAVPSSK